MVYQALTDATIIIRTVGERTTAMCRKLLRAPEHVVRATPFAEALRRSFEIGIDEARPYTIMVDADMLPLPCLLETLLDAARADLGKWFEKHALVLCKFFGRRGAGNRIYRTALLPYALTLVNEFAHDERPETAIIKAMAARGYQREEIDRVVALHGWEQFNRDIYRVAYVHGVKSKPRIERHLPKWRKCAKRDPDYIIAIEGAKAGAQHKGGITIDAGMTLAGWNAKRAEKGPLKALSGATRAAWKKAEKD